MLAPIPAFRSCRRRIATGSSYAIALALIGAAAEPGSAAPGGSLPATGASQAAASDESIKQGVDARLSQFKAQVAALSAPTHDGEYFADAKVPVKLADVRTAMLAYGNKERHVAGFRRVVGARTATDVDARSKTITNLDGKPEPVFDQPDMQLDERLNKAAQWLAEALATGRAKSHTATAKAKDGAVMAELGDRIAHFGSPGGGFAEIVASGWDAGASPYNWMAGDTHYRWYFGVDGTYPLIGYGAAQDAEGKWHYVGVAQRLVPASATPTPTPTVATASPPAAVPALLAIQNGGRDGLPPLTWNDDLAADAVALLAWQLNEMKEPRPTLRADGAGATLRATGMGVEAMMQKFITDRNPNIVQAGKTQTGCATAVSAVGERWLLCRWK